MAESFLKEQLERIRRMTERLSALEAHTAELSDAMANDRAEMRQGPLHEVRDCRLYSEPTTAGRSHETREPRRSEARHPSRRRRRG